MDYRTLINVCEKALESGNVRETILNGTVSNEAMNYYEDLMSDVYSELNYNLDHTIKDYAGKVDVYVEFYTWNGPDERHIGRYNYDYELVASFECVTECDTAEEFVKSMTKLLNNKCEEIDEEAYLASFDR